MKIVFILADAVIYLGVPWVIVHGIYKIVHFAVEKCQETEQKKIGHRDNR